MGEGARCEPNHRDQTDQARQTPEGHGEVLVQHAYSSGRQREIGRASTATLALSAVHIPAATQDVTTLGQPHVRRPSVGAPNSVAALSFSSANPTGSSAPVAAVGKPGFEVFADHVFDHLRRGYVACNRSKYRSVVSTQSAPECGVARPESLFDGQRAFEELRRCISPRGEVRMRYSIEASCGACEDGSTLLVGQISQAGEH